MKRKLVSVLLSVSLVAAMVMGCSNGDGDKKSSSTKTESTSNKKGGHKFGYTCMDGTNPFFVTLEDEIRKKVEANGDELVSVAMRWCCTKKSITSQNTKEENTMIAQCLYQSDPKNLASMGRQRLACQRAARKLQWGVQKERISETNEPVPLLMRPAVKEILQDAEQHRFDVLLIGNRDSLCCDAADMESFLTVLNSFNIHIFAGGQGSWVEPNGRHYAPLPRLPWQEDDVAEVPQ